VILLISDLHKTLESAEEMESVRWLLDILDELGPDVLVAAGDWGEAMTVDDFSQIASRVRLVTVYGNHENFPAVRSFALRDGEVVEAGGLRIAGVNGLICDGAEHCTPPGRFRRVVSRIGSVDIFVSHQPPSIPAYPELDGDEAAELMMWALEKIRPRLHLGGHMTGGCYSYYELKWGKYLRVDSSARFRCYALTDGRDVAVYQRGEEVFRFSL
jgi:predicted phosphodiesterase